MSEAVVEEGVEDQENGLPELPEGWEWKTLGEIGKIVGGSTPKSGESSYWGGDISWIAVSDLTGYTDKTIGSGARSITRAGYESCATKLIPEGSVLFSSRAPIGYVAIAASPLCTSQGFKSVVIEADISPDYLYWYLKSAVFEIQNRAGGTTFKEISGKKMAEVPVAFPRDRGKQEQIVRTLEERLGEISELNAQLDVTEELQAQFRQALLRDATTGRLGDNSERLDEDQDKTGLPEGWKSVELAELCESVAKVQPIENPNQSFVYIDISSIDRKTLKISDPKRLLGQDAPSRARQAVKEGDILFSTVRPNLRTLARVDPGYDGSVASTGFCVLRPKPELILSDFMFLALLTEDFQSRILTKARGVSYPAVRDKDILCEAIPLPPLSVQEQVVAIVENAEASLAQSSAALNELRTELLQLRSALLHQAFTGQLIA